MSWLHANVGFNTVLGSYDNSRFAIRAHMERGCTPILKVQFLPGTAAKKANLFVATAAPLGNCYSKMIICCHRL